MTASLYQSGSLMSCDFDRLAILRPSTDPPDGKGKFRIESDALMFSCPHDLAPAHQVLGPQGVVVGQAEFPERNFDIRLLGGVRPRPRTPQSAEVIIHHPADGGEQLPILSEVVH